MRKFSIFAALLLVIQLFLPFSSIVQAEEANEGINYLALGDSLAAGVNEKSELGYGYADFITKNYSDDTNPMQFNKGFAYPGYKTDDVLKDIQENITKPIYDLNGLSQTSISIQQAIQDADMITLSIGANDVLKNINRSESGQFTFNAAGVLKSIQEVALNYEKILTEIDKLNPKADVIVMGLYNPFPHQEDTTIQTQLNTFVSAINNSIKTVVVKNKGIFSEVAELISNNFAAYLPNPQNIHLGEVGYEAVAAQMMTDYSASILKKDEVSEEPVTTNNFTDISNHWGKDYINVAFNNSLMKGYEDGTFKPNTEMTRAQVLSVIARAFELPATKPAPFKDISDYNQQTQIEIAAAYEAGLVKANGGYFDPKGTITRSQLALILMRLSNNIAGEEFVATSQAPFKDILNYDKETKTAVSFLYEYGIVEGTSKDTFSPKGNITRAQFAKIIVSTMSED